MLGAKLTIEGRKGSVPMTGAGPWRLGRNPDADASFPDDRACSREHARITRDETGFLLEHLSASAATTVNGKTVSGPVLLRDGAVVMFGMQRVVFTLLGEDASEATTIGRMTDYVSAEVRRPLGQGLTVGRQDYPEQLVLDHPAVSRRHAAFQRKGETVVVRDLGSTNGTFVNGVRIDRPTVVGPGDRVDVGPFQLALHGDVLTSVVRTGKAELRATGITVNVKSAAGGGKTICILDDATFEIMPRELVCIIGSSGSGKSTLMNVLSGRALPSSGEVRLNGSNLHRMFEAVKQDIAFVPQQDVLHEQLTLRQALDYAAQLRLPRDTSAQQRTKVVEAAAASVDLTGRLDTRIAMLSGGQKKRASLASEILNRPSLLFLDEVTSGLDESTDWEIMRLLRRLADEGMTIVVVTHTLANLEEFCHKALCMGRGGHLTFAGPPREAVAFFGVERLGEIFNRMEEGSPRYWRSRFEEVALATTVVPPGSQPTPAIAPPEPVQESIGRRMRTVGRQFMILARRNVRLLVEARQTLAMAVLQSSLIGALTGYVFNSFGIGPEAIRSKTALLFLLGLTSIWLGCNGASKEIVGELPIYKRERDVNLSTLAFVLAKYAVASCFTVLQLAIVFALTSAFAESVPGPAWTQFGILVLGALAGTAIGLVISAFSDTRDQATTIVPLVLIPQIILAGILIPRLPAAAELVAKLGITSYRVTDALQAGFLPAKSDTLGLSVVIIVAQTVLFVGTAFAAMLLRHGKRLKRG